MGATFQIEKNERFELAVRFVTETAENIFLTGKAGTGKTTFLRYLRDHCLKMMLVAAPTGVAAINAGGVTLHSLFQLPYGPIIPDAANRETLIKQMRMGDRQRNLLRAAELLIIDEISMVRADVLDAIDHLLRHIRKTYEKPFGGMQILFIGDLHQLPPVVRDQDWNLLREFYRSPFFFDSLVMQERLPMLLELKKIYRQKNDYFTSLLNAVRINKLGSDEYELLNSRFIPHFEAPSEETYITLTSHNRQADLINHASLAKLPGDASLSVAKISGDFPESMYPADNELRLKTGAQVMFIKNDVVSKRYYNGKIGIVESISPESIRVRCVEDLIEVPVVTWDNTKYQLNRSDGRLQQEIIGTFTQFPLRLAWAITIHKSQGLTFEKLMIDAAMAFSTGQVYVALSRSTTLEGIVLLSKIPAHAIQSNKSVEDAHQRLEHEGAPEDRFSQAQKTYHFSLLRSCFSFMEIAGICNKLRTSIREHLKTLNVGADKQFDAWQTEVRQLAGTGEKFANQLQQLILGEEPSPENFLQERIVAAANHFQPKAFQLFEFVEKHTFITDSKETAEQISRLLNELSVALHEKVHVLTVLKEKFSVHEFYKARAAYVVHKSRLSIYSADQKNMVIDSEHPELMALLKSWRNTVCEASGQPVYMVATQAELKDICSSLPATKKNLGRIKGFGDVKLKRFSEDILDMVSTYTEKYNLQPNVLVIDSVRKKTQRKPGRVEKVPSSEISLGMLRDGLTVAEIAVKRGLAAGTILSHFNRYVVDGTLNLHSIFDEDVIKVGEAFWLENEGKNYAAFINKIPAGISYNELRLMRAARPVTVES